MGEVVAGARLWRHLAGARIRSEWQYRTSFFMLFAASFAVSALEFVGLLVLFEQVPALAGWSVEEVAFLYGTGVTASALADVFIGAIETVPDRVRLGTFDRLLVRPAPTLVQIVGDDFALRRLGKVLQSVAVLAGALVVVDVDWDAGRVAMVPVMVVTGVVLFVAIWVATNSVAFWFTDTREVANSLTYGGSYLSQHPLGVYGRWFRAVFAVAVPIAFVNYLPALHVLGRDDDLGFPSWVRFASPAVAVVALTVAGRIWSAGISHYRSTGS